jgi:DNA polymerase-3 subunit delta'
MTFKEVIGQEEVKRRLLQLVDEERVPHALMFCGPSGSGKLALAIAFGCYLLSGSKSDWLSDGVEEPMLKKLEHPDLHFTYPTIKLPSMGSDYKPVSDDFATQWHELLMRGPYFSMTEWMSAMGGENQQAVITVGESDALLHKLSLKSSQGGYKVSIIWLPERMNIECANKMLKMLEEPTQQTVFLMVSEEPDQLLETIRSRVQRIDVKGIDDACIQESLVSRYGLDDNLALRISRRAMGSWQKAVSELDSGSEQEEFLELFKQLTRLAYQRKVKELKYWSEEVAALGREKQKRFLRYFLMMVRENFVYNFGNEELCYLTEAEESFVRNFATFVNEDNVIPMSELATLALRDIGQNANAKIVFFDFALQMIIELGVKK